MPASPTGKESGVNVNTVILSLLLGLSSWHLKKLSDGLDKISPVEKTVAVIENRQANTIQQVSEIKDKMKERDSQWSNLETAVAEIRYKVNGLTGSIK